MDARPATGPRGRPPGGKVTGLLGGPAGEVDRHPELTHQRPQPREAVGQVQHVTHQRQGGFVGEIECGGELGRRELRDQRRAGTGERDHLLPEQRSQLTRVGERCPSATPRPRRDASTVWACAQTNVAWSTSRSARRLFSNASAHRESLNVVGLASARALLRLVRDQLRVSGRRRRRAARGGGASRCPSTGDPRPGGESATSPRPARQSGSAARTRRVGRAACR